MNHDHKQDHNSSNSIGKFVFIGFLLIAGFFLITEHRAHLSGLLYYLPFLFLLACPLMHLFHHRHSGHQEHEHGGTRSDNDRKGERK
jgi:hypothetical protein